MPLRRRAGGVVAAGLVAAAVVSVTQSDGAAAQATASDRGAATSVPPPTTAVWPTPGYSTEELRPVVDALLQLATGASPAPAVAPPDPAPSSTPRTTGPGRAKAEPAPSGPAQPPPPGAGGQPVWVFYRWATLNGHVERPPFSYRAPRSSAFMPGRRQPEPVKLAKERRGLRSAPGFLSIEDYLVFRAVGLRGRLPGGVPDPSFGGRHGHRNAVFAELLVTTGMRLGEAATLLVGELPAAAAARRSEPLPLAPAVCKGGRGRSVPVPSRVLRAVSGYVDLERANAVERGGARATGAPEVSTDGKSCSLMVEGRRFRVPLARMTPAHRTAALAVDEAGARRPMALWLTETGSPVSTRAWEAVFQRASARCRALGHPVEVSPHTLRHTFAGHMLSLLIREQIGSLQEPGATDSRHGRLPAAAR